MLFGFSQITQKAPHDLLKNDSQSHGLLVLFTKWDYLRFSRVRTGLRNNPKAIPCSTVLVLLLIQMSSPLPVPNSNIRNETTYSTYPLPVTPQVLLVSMNHLTVTMRRLCPRNDFLLPRSINELSFVIECHVMDFLWASYLTRLPLSACLPLAMHLTSARVMMSAVAFTATAIYEVCHSVMQCV